MVLSIFVAMSTKSPVSFEVSGDSYRLRAKRKSGLIKPPAADLQPQS